MKKIIALLLLSFPAFGADLFSQSFAFTGVCTGGDMVYSWSINGAPGGGGMVPPSYGESFLYPWLPFPITIRGVEVIKIPPAPGATSEVYLPQYTFLMVGNNAHGDAMLFVDAKELSGRNFFPSGTGFLFPSIANKTPTTYIDMHGSCTAGMVANTIVTFYYTNP